MSKLIKYTARIVGFTLEWVLAVIILFTFAIRTTYVQTKLASFVTTFLSKQLDTTVRLDRFDVQFLNTVELNGFFALDKQGDTLVDVGSLKVELASIRDLLKKEITISSVALSDGVVKIYKPEGSDQFNFAFIIDFFSTAKKKEKKPIPAIRLEDIELKNIRFHFDNYNYPLTAHGIDYSHLLLKDVNLKVSQFLMKNGIFSGIINNLSAFEQKSNFRINELKTRAVFSANGLDLKRVYIKTDESEIRSRHFQLIYSGMEDYSYFIDSVRFDADLNKTVVSFKDIAVFAPMLYGMDQRVFIDGKFENYVKNLKASNLHVKTGEKTEIKGTIQLPDFRDLKSSFYQERIEYIYADINDLKAIKLPSDGEPKFLALDPIIQRLGFLEGKEIRLDGLYSQFVLSADVLNTVVGSVNIDNGIYFTYDKAREIYAFKHSEAADYDVKVNNFNLGKLLASTTFGIVDGVFFLNGEAQGFSKVNFTGISGNVNRFELLGYPYSNIEIKEGSFIDNILLATVDVTDNNLDLTYKGTIDLNGTPTVDVNIDIDKAFLKKLNLVDIDSTFLKAKAEIQLQGFNPNTMEGCVLLSDVYFRKGTQSISVPNINLDIFRSEEEDRFELKSTLIDGSVVGKMDFDNLGLVIQDQISQIFPGFGQLAVSDKIKKKGKLNTTDYIDYNITLKDVSQVLPIFVPGLKINTNTTIKGNYDAADRDFDLLLNSTGIHFGGRNISNISLDQKAVNDEIQTRLHIGNLQLNDSISLDDVSLNIDGNGNNLISTLTWNPNSINETEIKWNTHLESTTRVRVDFEKSYFSINDNRWEINEAAEIILDSSIISVDGFKLEKGEQFIAVNGVVSKSDSDKLNFQIKEVNLAELGQLLGLNIALSGEANGWGYITNPYTNLGYMGDIRVDNLFINNEEVGNVYLQSQWDKSKDKIALEGDLEFKGVQTFDFNGTYDITKEKENLDFVLNFSKTNIGFLDAFMDPLVVSNIQGQIDGKLFVTGEIKRPVIDGDVMLNNAGAKVGMLGTSFSFNGKMFADRDGFYIDNMPITDAEGNTGSLNGTIAHRDFTRWNVDVFINLEEDFYKRDPINKWVKAPLDRFLALNTNSSSGDVYYGKAYVTGTVNIFGYLNNLDISVDAKTQKGTWIDLSLFGQSELNEDDFITFVSRDTITVKQEPKIDFTGVSLDFKFNVTPEAKVKVIFNEQTGDEIVAYGNGKIGMRLDNLGQLSLDGTYRVAEGSGYNFVMGPIKQSFYLEEGGTITWTGSPYDASLNLQAYYKVKTNIGELSPELLTSGQQDINAYLNLTESLMKPTISFDIKAPKAPEADKAILAQVASNKDELSRQFFSLLLWRKFQPMKGSSRASGGAALDLVSQQINSLLSQVSQDYKLNVDLNSDSQGQNEYAVGIQKGFLDDQLIITGSVGARNSTVSGNAQSSIIGDVEVEYKLNKEGTFRINVFNESNDTRVIQTQNRGQFKQGIGVYYKEDFNSFKDFKLFQKFLDIFRKKKNKRYPIRRKKHQALVPKENEE